MKKQLAFSVIFLLSGGSNAQEQEYAINCSKTPLLFPKQVLSKDFTNLDVTADQTKHDSKGNYLLTGNVSLNSSQYYLSADKIKIQKHTKTSSASGNVKFQSDKIMITGNKAVIKKQDGKALFNFEQVKFHYPESKINGQAQKIVDDGTKQTFDSATYSLCPIGNTDWIIKADKITLDTAENRGVAQSVVIEFMGVPIFYAPQYEWVLKGRASGFLSPSLGNYKESDASKDKGYQIRIPYYFNIAADRDFLLTLNQLSTRGSVIEGKYRQLLDEGRIEIKGHYLNKDDISKEKRWLIDTKLNLSLGENIKLETVSKRVSDKQYFKEIAHKDTSIDTLQSYVNLTYKNNGLGLSVFSESEQLVNDGTAEYIRAPEIAISKTIKGLGGRSIDLSVTNTKFKHKTSVDTGVRTHAQAKFTRKVANNAYALTPKFTVSKTKYTMDNRANQKRSIYSFGLDSKWFFERDTELFGKSTTQTLIPRLAYNYTPRENQSMLPNFDTEEKGGSYEELFSGEKFTGVDKISSNNSITLGLESDFIDKKTGDTYLSLKIAQARYLNDTAVDENGNLVAQEKRSNIIAGADLALGNVTLDNSLHYNSDTNKVAKYNNALSYISSPRKFITLTRGDDGEQKSVGAYGAYPITQKIHLFAGVNRSLTDAITNRKTTGFAYETCCWAVRVAQIREHLTGDDYDKITKFEMVFKGLTSSDPSLAERLKQEIPNYLVDLDK
ncbi:Outer membrane protein Imp, required for envelope biogenesis / Organic solvent tolerance protein precursor [uncultured Candidatus Thioglobus sp.]|nr:Outer membrane protein Imp, required for envelope biogenesis / Organic solvent tolerance protein precursor [uncultured Candidatus Thioglobus sp.]